MNKERISDMVTGKKLKVLPCSTPEHRQESPSRDSDSLCDSDAASPVPFLCTQDGAEGVTDVVWNFYTPKSGHAPTTRQKNSSPLTRRTKKSVKTKVIEKPVPKRRSTRATQKKTELFQDLIELNQNLHELIAKKSKKVPENRQSGSEEDIFSDAGDSPKSVKSSSRCLRRNLLSSKFCKPETETALESDDSINECLIKASQVVEENILNCEPTPAKRSRFNNKSKNPQNSKSDFNVNMDQESMDAILNSIKFESPGMNKLKRHESSHLYNDSFDSIFSNLNDSALERLTQMPVKNANNKFNKSKDNEWTVQEVVMHDDSFASKSVFGRHNSMPESPTVSELNKPSTSGMALGRYNSMPYHKHIESTELSLSRCTSDEIKRKHQLAREKLLAKRLLPFTSTQQQLSQTLPTQRTQPHAPIKINDHSNNIQTGPIKSMNNNQQSTNNKNEIEENPADIKSLIERKRQEALMRLRKRQQNRT